MGTLTQGWPVPPRAKKKYSRKWRVYFLLAVTFGVLRFAGPNSARSHSSEEVRRIVSAEPGHQEIRDE